jgi:hypothetical protein
LPRLWPSLLIKKIANRLINGDDNNRYGHDANDVIENPLAKPFPWWYELYQRIKLFPWWVKYNFGLTNQSDLKDKIISLAIEMNLEKRWVKKLIRHAVSEFSKKGLGQDYYGYHNIDHELQATYFTLLSANGHHLLQCNKKVPFSNNDIKYLFVSALFHDFDPAKMFDKPNEENVEWFLRSDLKIKKFIDIAGIDINTVIAIIYRTAYPFRGEIADIATKRIYKLLLIKGLLKDGNNIYDDNNHNSNNSELSKKIVEHYLQLCWFLSVCERIAGYALEDFEYSNKLARSNAHALGWHPSIINEESVKYFDSLLKQENEMCEFVLKGIPDNLKNNFFDNVNSFHNLYEKEKKIRKLIKNKQISFICKVEEIKNDYNNYYRNSKFGLDYYEVKNRIVDIYHNTPIPLKLEDSKFISSLSDPTTILITLRIKKDECSSHSNNDSNQNIKEKELNSVIELTGEVNEEDNRFTSNDIVGYVKGGPLENYKLRRGTFDDSYGKRNTAYMEWICMKPGYLGSTGGGGHLLRISFLQEAKNRGYSFVTGYVHRNVIMDRINKGEVIEILQKYNPDKLDYYRLSLNIKPNIV